MDLSPVFSIVFFYLQAASASEVAAHQHQYPFNVAMAAALHNQIGPVAAAQSVEQLSRQRPDALTSGNVNSANHMNSNNYNRG